MIAITLTGDEAPVDALGGPRRRAPGAGARCEEAQ